MGSTTASGQLSAESCLLPTAYSVSSLTVVILFPGSFGIAVDACYKMKLSQKQFGVAE